MKRLALFSLILLSFSACNQAKDQDTQPTAPDTAFASMLKNYYNERMALYPLEATMNGDTRFNNLLPADFTDSYRAKLKDFFTRYETLLKKFDRSKLNDNDAKSYDIFDYEIQTSLEGLTMHFMGSSMLNDKRASAFAEWSDSAIVYFRKGMAANYTLPKALVVKMIPQMEAMVFKDPTKSIFYEPLRLMPATFSSADKSRLTASYIDLINNKLVPAYKKLGVFLKNEYLPVARTTTGINALPGGDAYYKYLVKYWTTTNNTPDQIYQTGLAEVKRIRDEMESIKTQVKFSGDLKAFFEFMRTDKQFMPYKTTDEILNAFRNIQATIDPNLKKMFSLTPTTKFEIRQTEAFRAASASAEYYPGLPDNSRPGIFYIPIIDPTKFNITSGMESLFLHEAIPGHHYQMSIQSENKQLPDFRKFIWYGAYGEGYALYCESLGKELGLYTNPYQHMGALGDEIHRAIRLVVDVAMHTGKMTREEAIKYMMDNEAISEDGATAEIERYMAIPGQALSYKTGALKIKELRDKYSSIPGFTLSAFHTEYLKDGCMPLQIIEQSMDKWSKTLKK